MVVRVDSSTLRAAVGPERHDAAGLLVTGGRVENVRPESDGIRGVVLDDGGSRWPVWVGAVDRGLAGDCGCPEADAEPLCLHVVALTRAALERGMEFAASAAWDQDEDGETRELSDAAGELSRQQLVQLVVRHAANDRYFAALLRAHAGRLGPPTPDELNACREVIADASAITDHDSWELYDVVKAGEAVVEEIRVLAVRPPNHGLLDVVERALAAWDDLACSLDEYADGFEAEADEIGYDLADVHLDVCERLRPEPRELAGRLAALEKNAYRGSWLDAPDAYTDLLGEDGLAEWDRLVAD